MAKHWSISIVMKYVTHPDRKVVVVMVAMEEVAVGAAEVATDPAAEVVVKEAEETTTIRNLPRQNLEEALAQTRALREVKLVSSLNS
jgi:hypothetical protein